MDVINSPAFAQAVLRAIQDPRIAGYLVPRSIPQRAVDIPLVTDLPVNPQDGDEVYFVADSTNGILWHFRYRAGAPSAYRWEFVGGSPLHATVAAQESRSVNSYDNLATVGPSITVPLLGYYMVKHGATIMVDGNALTHGLMSYDVGGAVAADSWAVNYVAGTSLHRATTARTYRHGLLEGANRAFVAKYKSATSNGVSFSDRFMDITPIRVGRK
jgi:hypothetical protein